MYQLEIDSRAKETSYRIVVITHLNDNSAKSRPVDTVAVTGNTGNLEKHTCVILNPIHP